MDRNNLDRFYAENSGLIHTVAQKGYGRLQGIGASMPYEDLVQDLSVTFIKAFDQFDPEQGKFSTYFMRSAFNELNKIAADFEIERCELGIRSVEEMSHASDSDDANVLEAIAGDSLTPEQLMVNRSAVEHLARILSPLAQEIAIWIIYPPEFIGTELIAHQAHVDYARGMGHARRNKTHLGLGFVCEMMEMIGVASNSDLRRARLELQEAIERECVDE